MVIKIDYSTDDSSEIVAIVDAILAFSGSVKHGIVGFFVILCGCRV